MNKNPYTRIKENSIMTASPGELTLMLYDGALKFANQGLQALQVKDYQVANNKIIRVEDIIDELRATLDFKYEIAQEMDQLYEFIYYTLVQANIKKDMQQLVQAIELIREFRNTWKQMLDSSKKPANDGQVLQTAL